MRPIRTFLQSFGYAAKGLRVAVKEERNLRFHLCTAFYVYLFSFFYGFTRLEYCVLTLLIVGVISLELVNSAFERSMSRPSHEKYMAAGAVKDIAAGAVLVFCIGAAFCGFLMFWDLAVFARIFGFFMQNILLLILLLVSLAASAWFIFFWHKKAADKPSK